MTHPQPDQLDGAILDKLLRHSADLVILAGYMRKLGPKTIQRYRRRVLYIHPALLPKFGGKGTYGTHVHEAVLAVGERETGVTVHLVDEEFPKNSGMTLLEGITLKTIFITHSENIVLIQKKSTIFETFFRFYSI